jgi:ubiquinone/menaquinone biosynthesis C-methylase UbiE
MGCTRRILMRMFGRPEGLLGRLGGVIMARTNRDAGAAVIELLNVRPSEKVLEVGFGPGVGIQFLARLASAGYVAGVDQSPEMVRQASVRNAEAIGSGRVDLRRGSADALPVPDEIFDKAVAVNSMQAWPDAASGLREMRRVLKPGGNIALGFTPYSGQSRHGITDALTAAGFTKARMVEREKVFCAIAFKP